VRRLCAVLCELLRTTWRSRAVGRASGKRQAVDVRRRPASVPAASRRSRTTTARRRAAVSARAVQRLCVWDQRRRLELRGHRASASGARQTAPAWPP